MEADCVNTPEAFAEAKEKARLEYLRSLTLESAAEDLEALLSPAPEFEKAWENSGAPPPPPDPNPLPGPTLAILLEGKVSDD